MAFQTPTNLVNETQGLFEGMARWAYNVTEGFYWTGLLLSFCFVLFMASYRHGQDRAAGYAGITGLFGAIILLTMGLMPWWIASLFIIFGAIGLAYMIMNR